MGTSTSAARVGSFLSPYIVYSVSLAHVSHVFLKKKCKKSRTLTLDPGFINKCKACIVFLIRFAVVGEALTTYLMLPRW